MLGIQMYTTIYAVPEMGPMTLYNLGKHSTSEVSVLAEYFHVYFLSLYLLENIFILIFYSLLKLGSLFSYFLYVLVVSSLSELRFEIARIFFYTEFSIHLSLNVLNLVAYFLG